ncbi:MAG: spermidine synthase [Trebonia sp.]
MPDNLVRRRGAERLAVHREVGTGMAELVPDVDRPGSWLLFIDGVPQSQIDLDDPGYLEFEYVLRIAHVIDLAFPEGEPVRALHLGGGALTLPRYLAHTRPGAQQLVAEIDAELTELVREHLPLPGGRGGKGRSGRIRVRAEDARKVLESVRADSHDVIISDVYAGARTPFHMTTAECAQAAARALRPGGIYLVNVADGPPLKGIRSAVATVRSAFGETCIVAEPGVLRGRRTANFVIAASDRPLPVDRLRRKIAADSFPARAVDGDELDRFVSAAPVVTDATGPISTYPEPTNW